MITFKNSYLRIFRLSIFVFLLGCGLAMGQAPWSYTIIALFSLLTLFFVISCQKIITHDKLIFIFGLGYFCLSLHWIVQPFLVEGGVYLLIAPFGFLGLIILCSSFWTISSFFVLKISKHSSSLTVAFAILLGEITRSYFFSGFPWGIIGYIWTDTFISLSASWVGPIGLTGMTLFLTALPFSTLKPLKASSISVGIFLIILVAIYFQFRNSERIYSNSIVRLVQPNAVQEKKWDPSFAPIYFKSLIEMTSEIGKEKVDLIVWPESAIVPFLDDASQDLKKISQNMPRNSELILGIRSQSENKIFNSMILLDADGVVQNKYDKFHLVPFGEYLPFMAFFKQLGFIKSSDNEQSGFSAGEGSKVLKSNIGWFRPLICYEAIFFHEIYNQNRPQFIVNVTNDGWLGNWAGPLQHLQQVRMRAIENGIPIVRTANTGISAIIDPYGEIVDSIGIGLQDYKDIKLPVKLHETFYSRTGESVNFILILIWLLFLFLKKRVFRIDGAL